MSRLLVDTHALLWWLTDNPALPATARATIADSSSELLVSTASLWEIAIKRSIGKLRVSEDLPDKVAKRGFTWLPVRAEHVWAVRALPQHHRDPFDRLLVAQALTERMPVVTADARFAAYGVEVRW